jgi:DNA-binding phage protein
MSAIQTLIDRCLAEGNAWHMVTLLMQAKQAAEELSAIADVIGAAREFMSEFLSDEFCPNCTARLPEHDDSQGACKAGALAAALAMMEQDA